MALSASRALLASVPSFLLVLVVPACAATHETPGPAADIEASLADFCADGGSFDLVVEGRVDPELEGEIITIAAFEGDRFRDDFVVRALRGAVVRASAFRVACPVALRADANYPGVAAFIDLDRDGRCGEGDVGQTLEQYYGWSSDVTIAVDAGEAWAATSTLSAWTTSRGSRFCDAYFAGVP